MEQTTSGGGNTALYQDGTTSSSYTEEVFLITVYSVFALFAAAIAFFLFILWFGTTSDPGLEVDGHTYIRMTETRHQFSLTERKPEEVEHGDIMNSDVLGNY